MIPSILRALKGLALQTLLRATTTFPPFRKSLSGNQQTFKNRRLFKDETICFSIVPCSSQEALNSITSDEVMRHIGRLGSDEFEGRAPGTQGEETTINYLESVLK